MPFQNFFNFTIIPVEVVDQELLIQANLFSKPYFVDGLTEFEFRMFKSYKTKSELKTAHHAIRLSDCLRFH